MRKRPGFSLIWAVFLLAVCASSMALVGLSVAHMPMRGIHLDGRIAQARLGNYLTDMAFAAAYEAVPESSDVLASPASCPEHAEIFCQKGMEAFGSPDSGSFSTYETRCGSSTATITAQSDLTRGLALGFAEVPFYSESENIPENAFGIGFDGQKAYLRKDFGGGLALAKNIRGLKTDYSAAAPRTLVFSEGADIRTGFAGTAYCGIFVDLASLGSGAVSLVYDGTERHVYVLYGHAGAGTLISADGPIVATDAMTGVPPTIDGRDFPVFVCPFGYAAGPQTGE